MGTSSSKGHSREDERAAMDFMRLARERYSCKKFDGHKVDESLPQQILKARRWAPTAKSLGVDSCWVNSFNSDALAATLALPEGEIILMALDLGYPTEGAESRSAGLQLTTP